MNRLRSRARKPTKPLSPNPSPKPEHTAEQRVAPSRLKKLFWGAAVLLLVTNLVSYGSGHNEGYDEGSAVGYSDGFDEGYDEGYGVGRQEGFNDGYTKGEAAGYADGYSAGGSSGYSEGYYEGYSEGNSDGCESVFDRLGFMYTYVTAYDPYNSWNRYPSKFYTSKNDC